MEIDRLRRVFAWTGVGIVVLSAVAFPIIDSQASTNYRAIASVGSDDMLLLATGTDDVLATAYGLVLAVRTTAPGATLVIARGDVATTAARIRLAGLAGAKRVVAVDGSSRDWASGALLDGNVVASMPAAGGARAWELILDPAGDNDTLVLIEGQGRRDLVVSAALLRDTPR